MKYIIGNRIYDTENKEEIEKDFPICFRFKKEDEVKIREFIHKNDLTMFDGFCFITK